MTQYCHGHQADESFSSAEEKAGFYRAMFRDREAWESYFLPQLEK